MGVDLGQECWVGPLFMAHTLNGLGKMSTRAELEAAVANAEALVASQESLIADRKAEYNAAADYAESVSRELKALQVALEEAKDKLAVAVAELENYKEPDSMVREELVNAVEEADKALDAAEVAYSEAYSAHVIANSNLITAEAAYHEAVAKESEKLAERQAAEAVVDSKKLALDIAIAHLDDYDAMNPDPEPDPDPNVILDPIELVLDGEQVDFGMKPPEDLVFGQPHPRFFSQSPEEMTERLSHHQYDRWGVDIVNDLDRHVLESAVDGPDGAAAGYVAASKLLVMARENTVTEFGAGVDHQAMYTCLRYDWLYDYLTKSEAEEIMRYAVGQTGLKWPEPGDDTVVEFDNYPANRRTDDYNSSFNFGNDGHEPKNHQRGFLPRVLVALAFYGDGIRDEWCKKVIEIATTGTPGPIYKMYGANGGLYSGHALLGLDSGGCQSGHHEAGMITGYSDMFFTWPALLGIAWHSATGDKNVFKDSFIRFIGKWLVYCHNHPRMTTPEGNYVGGEAACFIAMAANLFKDADPDMSKLAMWVLRQGTKAPYGTYATIFELFGGDRRLPSASPEELNLPLAYLSRGGDSWDSRDSWDRDTATHVSLTTRIGDHLRYEKHAGLLRINRGMDEVVVSGQAKKGMRACRYGSGVWIWADDPTTETPYDAVGGQGNGSYWAKPSMRGSSGAGIESDPAYIGRISENRPADGDDGNVVLGATHRGYRGLEVEPFCSSGSGWSRIQQDMATLGARLIGGKLWNAPGIYKNERTVLHLSPFFSDSPGIVVVRDRVSHTSEYQSVFGIRVMGTPTQISPMVWEWTVGNTMCRMTGLRGMSEMKLKGGDPVRTEGPFGESYDGSGYYFKDDPNSTLEPEKYDPRQIGHSESFGLHAIFGYPEDGAVETEYLTLFVIGDPDSFSLGFRSPRLNGDTLVVGDNSGEYNMIDVNEMMEL